MNLPQKNQNFQKSVIPRKLFLVFFVEIFWVFFLKYQGNMIKQVFEGFWGKNEKIRRFGSQIDTEFEKKKLGIFFNFFFQKIFQKIYSSLSQSQN